MPFKSVAQQRYFNANRAKLEKQGVDVDEWNKATDYSSLPDKKGAWRKAAEERAKRGND